MHFDKSKPYIFFSYAHKESETGLEIIKELQKNNFNIWYDEGIEVGTEYSDYIAEHIEGCKVFVCLMDENYINSRYCRDEIDFALNTNGVNILIIYKKELKDLDIPAGLKMRTSRYQAVFLNRFGSLEKFMDSMLKAEILAPCNEKLAKSKDKTNFTIYEECGFVPTFFQKKKAQQLVDMFALFGVKIDAFIGVTEGARVTKYEFRPSPTQKVSKILALADDIALTLGVDGVRLICPLQGKVGFAIEVPHDAPRTVTFEEIFSSDEFKKSTDKLCVVLGMDIDGRNKVIELSRAPHLLIGGQTFAGKSNLLHNMILSLIKNTSHDEVKLVLVDPKKSEFGVYAKSKHLLTPIITDEVDCYNILNELFLEAQRRLELFVKNEVKDIVSYNRISSSPLPRIVVFIDEMSPIIGHSPRDFETIISRLINFARASGIHLVLASGDISTNTFTGIIKANLPTRIALSVTSAIESRIIIDTRGAEKLLLKGDMLYQPLGLSNPIRLQGAYIDTDKIPDMIAFDCTSAKPQNKNDDEIEQAIRLAKQYDALSPSLLEQRMNISYKKALKIIKKLDELGYLIPSEGRGKPRKLKKEKVYE